MKKYDFLILGSSGMQGKIVARDLLEKGYRVLLTDIYSDDSRKLTAKHANGSFRYLDVRQFRKLVEVARQSGADIVVNCAYSDYNLIVYRACLQAKVNVIDLEGDIKMTEKQLAMSRAFEKRGLTAITGCGSTPGINNVMLNYAQRQFDCLETVNAGFAWDSNIKKFVPPFSVQSIIWEFTQPAWIVKNGKRIKRNPLENIVEMDFKYVGRQNCFLVEHPETFTFYHYYRDKGLRNINFYASFPKHTTEVISTLIALGLGGNDKLIVDGSLKVAPADLLAEVFRRLPYPEGYTEEENLWVEIIGQRNGEPKRVLMECHAPTLPGWEDAGCNIDTGFPASIIARMIKDGRIRERGSFAPEAIVPEEEFFKELWNKGMVVYQDGVPVNGEAIAEPARPSRGRARQIEAFV